MHSSHYEGYSFHYNGDYSGEIRVYNENGLETVKTFSVLAVTAQFDVVGDPYVQAVRGFIAEAVINEAISHLEQMEPDEALLNPWLRAVLDTMTTPAERQ